MNKQELYDFTYYHGTSCGGFYALLCERNKILNKDFPQIKTKGTRVKTIVKVKKADDGVKVIKKKNEIITKKVIRLKPKATKKTVKPKVKATKKVVKPEVKVIKKKNEIITKRVIVRKPAAKKVKIHTKNNFNSVVDFFKKSQMDFAKDISRSGRCYIVKDKNDTEYTIRYNLTYDNMLQEIKHSSIEDFLNTYNDLSNAKKRELKLAKRKAKEEEKIKKIELKLQKKKDRQLKKVAKVASKKEKEKDLTKIQKIAELQKRRTDIILDIMHFSTKRGSDKHQKLREEHKTILSTLEELGVSVNNNHVGAIDEETISAAKERAKEKKREKKILKEKAKTMSGILVKAKEKAAKKK